MNLSIFKFFKKQPIMPCNFKFFTAFIVATLFFVKSYGQNLVESNQLFEEHINTVYKNPEQTLKVANYLLTIATTPTEIAKAQYLIAIAEFTNGAYKDGLTAILKARQQLNYDDPSFINALVLIAVAERYNYAGMVEVSLEILSKTENIIAQLPKEQQYIIKEKIKLLKTLSLTAGATFVEAPKTQALNSFLNTTTYPALYAIIFKEQGTIYVTNGAPENAAIFFNKSNDLLKQYSLDNSALAAAALEGLGNVYFLQNNYPSAKRMYLQALKKEVMFPETQFSVTNQLSSIYKMEDSTALYQKYYSDNLALKAKILQQERESRSILISHLEEEQQMLMDKDEKRYYTLLMIPVLGFLLILIGYYFYNKKLNKEYEKFKILINKVNHDKKISLRNLSESEPASKSLNIPEETEKAIIGRLQNFENSTKFTDSALNLNKLAKQLHTNSKYLSATIHTHKHKNFNSYINELRVNYIVQLINTDKKYLNYKVSYLAEKAGFTSHSSFTTVFKSVTGFTPKQFVNFSKKQIKEKT